MFDNEQGKRKMALGISHYAYRNTVLEDYHSECIKMDMSFYKKIYRIVYTKLKNAKLLHKYIENYSEEKLESKEDLDRLLNNVPEDLRFKFMRYLSEVLFGSMCGVEWDLAETLECNLNGKSLANYVLAGNFLECCKNGAILNDKTMRYINKDIHNRIYTLLINGYFS